ncbi:hypothetical protein Poli38472_005514 [Pythium oligandrum]|uniref:Kinesin motor domain-containing protein n=1 Tax=Pythium oligandrum TaxID=41045 RepID=A0A8K1FHM4_PYTOL|nr:hypothetical protein Poli38472_005514 [Pythium oligandrum]|eukprot:TMW62896.1 hypothetical protein Poli38472_005514 [Pythium oligandrum]
MDALDEQHTAAMAEEAVDMRPPEIKVRCDSDTMQSMATDSTVSSAASSPSNEASVATTSVSTPSSPQSALAKRRSLPSPSRSDSGEDAAAAIRSRFGITRPVMERRTLRRTLSNTELPGRVRAVGSTSPGTESVGKAKKVSAIDSRRASYALSLKTRMPSSGNLSDASSATARKTLARKRSPTPASATAAGASSFGFTRSATPSSASSFSTVRPPALANQQPLDLITPTVLSAQSVQSIQPPSATSTRRTRRDSIGSNTSSVSSVSSTPSTTSNVSTISSRSTASSRLQRVKSSPSALTPASTPGRTSTASSRTGSAAAPSATKLQGVPPPKASVVEALRLASDEHNDTTVDNVLVQELKQQYELAEVAVQQLLKPSTSSTAGSTLSTRQEELRRLKGGIKRLSEHGEALLLACEVLQKQQSVQQEELLETQRVNDHLIRELAESSPVPAVADLTLTIDEEPSSDVGRRLSADSPLSAYVNDMLKKATEKIEEKWKARFAEQVAEHERALAQERERASASSVTNSRLVSETKHEREEEVKALREENVSLKLENKQMAIEIASMQRDVDYVKQQLDDQDELRSTSASFWQKTTDLAKKNRMLMEEVTLLQQNASKLNEATNNMKEQCAELRAQNSKYAYQAKELETEKLVLQDTLSAMEAKFEDEKARREQFQVNVEQLTVENTALYAQMVALQTTHEAKMEELRASFEKRNVILAGEMRALQTQNMLMRKGESSGGYSRLSSILGGSTPADRKPSALSAEAEQELQVRLEQMTDELLVVRQELVARTDQIAELERKVAEGETMRRKLHNTIQELRGNIRVHVRLRPFLRSDGVEGSVENPRPAMLSDSFGSTISTNVDKPHTFAFDKVYAQSDSQEAVFSDVSDFIQSAMDGYNVCIFAYGQTGSGKTHTMQGSGKAQMRGIIPRAIQLIINTCRDLTAQGWQYALEVSFYEIYNETIRDLLVADSGNDDRKYNVRTDRRGKNYVEGLMTYAINFECAEEQLEEIVNLAACNRSVDKTDMNAHSSRSHSIFGLTIRGFNEAQNTEVEGSLSLVDLAGSERLSRSNATGDRLKEAQAINKSLSALADVFQALAKKSAHVPYRNSKLTYVLQPALSGDGKTLMMVNLSPTFASLDESICSLRFAQNVSQCELGAPTRQIKPRVSSGMSNGPMSAPASMSTPVNVRNSPSRMSTPTQPRHRSLMPASGGAPSIAKKLFS